MSQDAKLVLEIKNRKPIELTDLTRSLNALADEYRRKLAIRESVVDAENIKLYVKEIRSGSIITELVALAPYALPLIDNTKTIFEYAEHLKSLYDFLLGKAESPTVIEKSTLQNLSDIIEPVAKDGGSQLNIAAMNINAPVTFNFTIGSIEANAAQNAAHREMEKLKEPVYGLHTKVLMYWWQARKDLDSKTGDKAKIESIGNLPVKVVFDNDAIKAAMLMEIPHPFKKAFVVDVAVETINDKPVLYRVLRLHESFDID